MVEMRDDPSLPKMGPMAESEWEHVAADDVSFNRIEIKTEQGVAESPSRVAEAMEPMSLMALMPVIKIVIVEQGASNQRRIIYDEVLLFRI